MAVLTIEAAETLCMVCLPPEEHIFRKNIWVTDLQKVTFCKGLTIKFVFLRIFKNCKMNFSQNSSLDGTPSALLT